MKINRIDTKMFIRWTRRNLTGSDGDLVLLLMACPEGLTAEELMNDLNIKRRALWNILMRLKNQGIVTEYRRYSGRRNLKLGNSKIKVYRLAISPDQFMK